MNDISSISTNKYNISDVAKNAYQAGEEGREKTPTQNSKPFLSHKILPYQREEAFPSEVFLWHTCYEVAQIISISTT